MRRSVRLLGIVTLLAGALFLASLPLGAVSEPAARLTRIAGLLLLVPAALHLARALAPRGPVLVWSATAAGVASLVWWSLSGLLLPWAWEPGYILLSGVWWLVLGWALLPVHRAFAVFTLVLGVDALVDSALTAAGDAVPFWAFALFGGPKLLLQVAWTIWLGVALLRGRIPRDAVDAR